MQLLKKYRDSATPKYDERLCNNHISTIARIIIYYMTAYNVSMQIYSSHARRYRLTSRMNSFSCLSARINHGDGFQRHWQKVCPSENFLRNKDARERKTGYIRESCPRGDCESRGKNDSAAVVGRGFYTDGETYLFLGYFIMRL